MLPVPSHYNACFGLANSLRENGEQVVFTGINELRVHVEQEGFMFTPMPYIDSYIISRPRIAIGLLLKRLIDKLFLYSSYKDFCTKANAFRNLYERLQPDTIYIDQHLSHYIFLIGQNYQNVILLNTKLPTGKSVGIPPLNCSIPFKESYKYKILALILWKLLYLKRKSKDFFKYIVLFTASENTFFYRFAKRNNIDFNKRLLYENSFYTSVKNTKVIHLCPRIIEYDWYSPTRNELFYFKVYNRKIVEPSSCNKIFSVIQSQKKDNNYIVYASLGTLSDIKEEVSIVFLKKLLEAVKNMPDVLLIISAGRLYSYISKLITSNNTNIYEWVPQQEILSHCNLMVTHGGMNSICDCLTSSVPMLVYPLNEKSDQPGNAARIVSKGWGLTGNMLKDKPQEINKKIREILSSYEIKENVEKCYQLLKAV
jgi:zeaxanthin glucosyltransferase